MQNNVEPLAYSAAQVAKLLGVGKSLVYEGIRRHELPVLKIGKRLLIPRIALERLVNGTASSSTTGKEGAAHVSRQQSDVEP